MAAALIGVWTVGESTAAITLTGRTSTAGSLITVTGGLFGAGNVSVPTDSFTNAYTERLDVEFDTGGNSGRANLSYNLPTGTRGGSHTISKADDGANSLGAAEWSGVATAPTIASASTAVTTSTAPSASVAVGAASLAILFFGYGGATTTMAIGDTDPGTEAYEQDENSDQQACACHYKLSATGTVTITGKLGASRPWGAGIVCFTEAVGGGTVNTECMAYLPPRRGSHVVNITY